MENQNPNILSKRGKEKFHHNGYLYRFHKMSATGEVEFWRCEHQATADIKCKGRLHKNAQGIRTVGNHTCIHSAANVETQRVVTAIKRRAEQTQETPQIIRAQALQEIPTPVLYNIPSKNATKKLVKRVRKEIEAPPPVPQDVQQLVIPDPYKIYKRGPDQEENFLLADSGPFMEGQRLHRIIIFGRHSFGAWSGDMKQCYVDGTFSITPAPFSQVYVILAKRGQWVLPVLHILLTGKSEAIYAQMFELIKGFWPQFNPTHMGMDFERAAINAAKNSFDNISIDLCLFHLVHNMKKRIHELGLTHRYDTDAAFSLKARMITSLAFLPLARLTHGIWALEGDGILPAELQPVFDWFLTNYTGRPLHNGNRTVPLFDPEMWSVFQRTVDAQQRTNNHAEAAHRRLQLAFRCDHPTIWHFITILKTEQKLVDADLARCVIGENPPPKALKYRKADTRILNLINQYAAAHNNAAVMHNGDHNYQLPFNPQPILDFLTGIAKNYEMNK